jgi:hypothetical protein
MVAGFFNGFKTPRLAVVDHQLQEKSLFLQIQHLIKALPTNSGLEELQ